MSEPTFDRSKKQFAGRGVVEIPAPEAGGGKERQAEAAGDGPQPGQDHVAGCSAPKVVRSAARRVSQFDRHDRARLPIGAGLVFFGTPSYGLGKVVPVEACVAVEGSQISRAESLCAFSSVLEPSNVFNPGGRARDAACSGWSPE